ncbi:MAG: hypothetical protein FWG82_01850 [Oscillospiraceae bacterium]|nr:hypothetical protein [Oscillospiraceae bacterium]
MTHDEAMNRLFSEYEIADQKRYTDFFLSQLSDSNWNSGLYVYAAMKTFPKHVFSSEETHTNRRTDPCHICSSYRENINDESKYHTCFFVAGLKANDIYKRFYVLNHINNFDNAICINDYDFTMFREILLFLQEAELEATIRDIQKLMKKSNFYKHLLDRMKSNGMTKGASSVANEKIQFILEALGVCGVLHTENQKAPFYEYINLAVAPRSSRNSDWAYPVDFWRGQHGIDWDAFDYWFGGYKELKDLNKQRAHPETLIEE